MSSRQKNGIGITIILILFTVSLAIKQGQFARTANAKSASYQQIQNIKFGASQLTASEGWDFQLNPPSYIWDKTGQGNYNIDYSIINKSTNDTYRGLPTVLVITVCRNPDGHEQMFRKDDKFEMKNGDIKKIQYDFHSNLKLGKMLVQIQLRSPNGKTEFAHFEQILNVER